MLTATEKLAAANAAEAAANAEAAAANAEWLMTKAKLAAATAKFGAYLSSPRCKQRSCTDAATTDAAIESQHDEGVGAP